MIYQRCKHPVMAIEVFQRERLVSDVIHAGPAKQIVVVVVETSISAVEFIQHTNRATCRIVVGLLCTPLGVRLPGDRICRRRSLRPKRYAQVVVVLYGRGVAIGVSNGGWISDRVKTILAGLGK